MNAPVHIRYGNMDNLPLSLKVFLAKDHYDHNPDPNTFSVTTLVRPVRQIVLAERVNTEEGIVDLEALLPSRVGAAIHNGIDEAWKSDLPATLSLLGYPNEVIKHIRVNPTDKELRDNQDIIPVYLEQRSSKKMGKYTVTGKYDAVIDGSVEDIKTTSSYTFMNSTRDEEFILQGSMYRWLNPHIITSDVMRIIYIFTDWSGASARSNPKYPQKRYAVSTFQLMSEIHTHNYVAKKIKEIDFYRDKPEPEIPRCEDKDLWRSAPIWKYYKDRNKTDGRSTKNFADKTEAYIRLAQDGNTGLVIENPGQVRACKYCAAFTVCSQKDEYLASGELVI